ncbi:MAG: hypothetical protein U0169_27645 [Polyangiaceae bacterium]
MTRTHTRAAKDFPYPITQPGIHQQVSKLEGALGEPHVTFPPNLPHTERQLRAVESVAPADQVLTASSTDAILGFVAAGLGYSLVPWPTPSGPKVPGVRVETDRVSPSSTRRSTTSSG